MSHNNEADFVNVRQAKKEDMKMVANMIQELADFEKMPNGPKISATDLERDGYDTEPPAFLCKVAEVKNNASKIVVGYALYFSTYSTWEGPAMMLEDLYVQPEYRSHGIGGKLFKSVAKEATKCGCSRLDFHVLEWNKAKSFYESRGAENLTNSEKWCYYRLHGEALQNLTKE